MTEGLNSEQNFTIGNKVSTHKLFTPMNNLVNNKWPTYMFLSVNQSHSKCILNLFSYIWATYAISQRLL